MKMQFKNLTVRSGLFTLAALTLAACGHTDKNQQNNTTKENTKTQEVAEVETPATSGISFKDEDAKTVSLNSLKGKVVFINFWATWCPPCIHEMPSINELKKSLNHNDDIVFLMVDVDNKMEKSSAFMKENGYDLPVYVPVSDIPSDYLGGAIPTTVILDKNGNIATRMEGGRDYTDPQIAKGLNELVESN